MLSSDKCKQQKVLLVSGFAYRSQTCMMCVLGMASGIKRMFWENFSQFPWHGARRSISIPPRPLDGMLDM